MFFFACELNANLSLSGRREGKRRKELAVAPVNTGAWAFVTAFERTRRAVTTSSGRNNRRIKRGNDLAATRKLSIINLWAWKAEAWILRR